ncbi:MAG: DUF2397 family protein [Acidimicrobiaceae bacterium]|nr:DUF2397 family protein [Acidimicrobiaceae bacterium]
MGNGDRPGLFRFTTSDLGSLYVAIMAAFEESAVLAPALNIEQVGPALVRAGWDEPIDEDLLGRALAALTGWRRLEATTDHGARFATPEEFERKNLLWAGTQGRGGGHRDASGGRRLAPGRRAPNSGARRDRRRVGRAR